MSQAIAANTAVVERNTLALGWVAFHSKKVDRYEIEFSSEIFISHMGYAPCICEKSLVVRRTRDFRESRMVERAGREGALSPTEAHIAIAPVGTDATAQPPERSVRSTILGSWEAPRVNSVRNYSARRREV